MSYEKLEANELESPDGSNYLGHMRREGGQFGSYPVHDDYSEESEP